MPAETLRAIHDLLATERQALLQGAYDTLEEIADQKGILMSQLADDPPKIEELRSIKRLIDQNQVLVTSAMTGIARAKARLASLRSVQNGLTTYDRSGALTRQETKAGQVERKA